MNYRRFLLLFKIKKYTLILNNLIHCICCNLIFIIIMIYTEYIIFCSFEIEKIQLIYVFDSFIFIYYIILIQKLNVHTYFYKKMNRILYTHYICIIL